MHMLGRYVFRQAAGAFLLILLSLTGMTWIGVALRQLELMTTQGQDALRYLTMTTLAVPTMMALIAPIALLIAAIYVLNRLNTDSELIVMTAGGMPSWAVFNPLALLALLVAVGVAVVNHWVGPWSQSHLRDYTTQVRTELVTRVIQPWRFTSPESNLTIHIRDRSETGELLGLLLHDGRDAKQDVYYLAERAQIIRQTDAAYLRMQAGHIVRRLANEPVPQIVAFDSYAVDLNRLEQRIDQSQVVRPRERYTHELLKPDPEDPIYKASPGRYSSELHERFSSPLYAFTFVLLALAFNGQAQTTRTTRIQGAVAAFAAAVVCRLLGIGATNFAVIRPSATPLLYVIPIATAALGAALIQWHLYPRPRSRLAAALVALWARVRQRAARLWQRARVLQVSWQQSLTILRARILRRYVARRFLLSIVAAFVVCATLIFMIDMIELLRLARRASELSVSQLLWIGLLRLPAYTEILLAFAVLVGSVGALLSLNRKSELAVMRSGGMSVWQFLLPGMAVALLLGIAAVSLYNPLAAGARAEAERLVADSFGREASLLAIYGDGSWLRQDGVDGQSVMNAKVVANQGLSLAGVIIFQFDGQGRFVERIDAERASLGDGYWELQKAVVSRPGREAETFDTYAVSTYLTRERVGDALGSEIAVSFWQLPGLIEVAEKAGVSASRYKMQYALLMARPLLLVTMVVLAATVSLRSFRSGGIPTMVLLGMVGGIGFFLLSEVSRQIGLAGLVSPAAAVGVPIALALLGSLTVLLHQEDG
jgi:lipopolysaccharide export system permease protein